MNADEEEALIEEAASAFRAGDPRAVAVSPAWYDLSPDARERAFQVAVRMRAVEAALDPRGRSATVKAVLGRIAR